MNSRTLILPLLVSVFIAGAMAQDAKIQVRFAAQALPPDMPEIVMATGELRSEPFAISSESLTLPQEAPGMAFSLMSSGAEKEFAKVILPANGSRFIVLVVVSGEGKVAPVVIRDDRSKFGEGDVYAFNAMGKPVLGQLGTAQFRLKPGQGKMVRPTGIVEEQYYEVRFAVQEEQSTRMFSSTRWPAGLKERCYVFFYTDASAPDRAKYHVIGEVLHPEKPEE